MAEETVRVRLEAVVAGFQRGMGQARESAKGFGAQIERNEAQLTRIGIGMAAAGGAILLGLAKAGREAARFDATVTKMTTQVGIARDEAHALGQRALGLSETGRGPQELAEALFFVTSAGMRGKAALDVLEASAKASAIGLGDTATVADLVTSAVNAYGPAVLNAEQATDVLVAAVREGKAEAPALAAAMGMVLPIASEMGVTFDQVGAATAAMTRTGTDAGTATMQLRQILIGLLKPTKQAEDTLEEFGLSAAGLREQLREQGLISVLMTLREAFGENETAMGKVFENARSLSGVLDLVGANGEENAAIFERMTDTTGLLSDGFQEWASTTEASQQRFSAAMEAARISAGEELQGAMRFALDTGTALASMFTDMHPAARTAVVGIAGVTGATLALGGTALIATVQVVKMARAIGDASSVLGTAARFLIGPWGLAIGAATLAVGMFVKSKVDQQRAIAAVRETLEAETGAITQNTREWVANSLQQEGAVAAARTLGISLATLMDATLGDAEAQAELSRQLNAAQLALSSTEGEIQTQIVAIGTLGAATGSLTTTVEEAMNAEREHALLMSASSEMAKKFTGDLDRLNVPMGRLESLAGEGATAAGELALSLDDLEGQAGEARSAVEMLTEALDAMSGGQISAERAAIRLREQIASLGEELDKGSRSLDINTEAGRTNRGAILDAVDAALGLASAMVEEGHTVETATGFLNRHVEEIVATAVEAGLAEDEVRRYIDRLNLTPESVATTIKLHGLELAQSAASGWEAQLARLHRQVTATVNLRTTGSIPSSVQGAVISRHSGGYVDGSGPFRRLHSGGPASLGSPHSSLRSDERLLVAQTGEFVLSRAMVSALQAPSSPSPTARPPVHLTLDLGQGITRRIEVAFDAHDQAFAREMGGA